MFILKKLTLSFLLLFIISCGGGGGGGNDAVSNNPGFNESITLYINYDDQSIEKVEALGVMTGPESNSTNIELTVNSPETISEYISTLNLEVDPLQNIDTSEFYSIAVVKLMPDCNWVEDSESVASRVNGERVNFDIEYTYNNLPPDGNCPRKNLVYIYGIKLK